jgi:glycosidase
MWAEIVDGFRCDVAPVIPIEFWIKARKEVAKVRKDCIWLAESIEFDFINTLRRQGFIAQSDCEMYSAFDICYDYDIYNDLMDYFMGKGNISSYIDALNRQESIYPDNYVKLHFLENHDRLRAHKMIENPEVLINFTAFLYFMKGSVLLYNGQEIGDKHFISLFEKETVDWNFNKYEENSGGGVDLENLLKTLYKIKKKKVFTDGYFKASIKENHIIYAEMEDKESRIIGIFEIDEHKGNIEPDIEDGFYKNLIDGKEYEVRSGILTFTGSPIIFEIKK